MDGQEGTAALAVGCEGDHGVQPIVGREGGVLTQVRRRAPLGGASWSWSGDPENLTSGPIRHWLRVNGTLECDVEITLTNRHASVLAGDLEYVWSGIAPCPAVPKGCEPCPADVCGDGEVAVCDGGRYWDCQLPPGVTELPLTSTTTSTATPLSTTANATAAAAADEHWRDGAEDSAAVEEREQGEVMQIETEEGSGADDPGDWWFAHPWVDWTAAACVVLPILVLVGAKHLRHKRSQLHGLDAPAPSEDLALLPPAWAHEQDEETSAAQESQQSPGSHSRPRRQGYPPGYEPLQTS